MLRSKGVSSAEIKYIDVSTATSTAPDINALDTANGPVLKPLDNIAEDDTYKGRTGIKVYVRKIKFYLNLIANNAGDSDQYVRFMIVRDRKPTTESAPTLAELFQVPSNGNAPTTLVQGMQSFNTFKWVGNRNQGRFKMLVDRTIKLSKFSGDASNTIIMKKVINIFRPAQWNRNNAGDLGTGLGPGQIYVFIYGSAVANKPTWHYSYRLSYTDL